MNYSNRAEKYQSTYYNYTHVVQNFFIFYYYTRESLEKEDYSLALKVFFNLSFYYWAKRFSFLKKSSKI